MRKFKKSTLIKWTIAIAIIGILASILFPSYCDYLPRAKWAKAIASIAVLKLAVGESILEMSFISLGWVQVAGYWLQELASLSSVIWRI